MLILRDPALARRIEAPEIRRLVEQWFLDVSAEEPYEPDIHGFVIIVEPGDSVRDLEEESGCPIEDASSPCFEVVEELDSCYEMVFVPGDGDFGVVVFIPKQEGIDPDLLAMCAEYAIPVP